MLKLSIIFIVFVAVIILVIRGVMWEANLIIRKYIGGKNKAAEEIINSQKAPKDWTDKFEKKIEKLGGAPIDVTKRENIEKKGKEFCLKRVSQLINYFKTSTLVQDEETRKILLNELQKARNSWEEKNWGEIIA